MNTDQTKAFPDDSSKSADGQVSDGIEDQGIFETKMPDSNTNASDPSTVGPSLDTAGLRASIPGVLRERIGRYKVIGVLGKGGCGEVFRAFDEDLNRQVAIKVVRSKFEGNALKHLLDEAKIVASLDSNPHIVPVYTYDVLHEPGQADPVPFIVSKLIDGSDFRKRLLSNRPTVQQTLTIVKDIAEALYFAHTQGLIHRDIKPENILLDKNDNAYLADFGIAKRESDHSDRSNAGTVKYMSPEQARGEGHLLTIQSDIYSLGLVLYEALSCYPYQIQGLNQLIECVRQGQLESPRLHNPLLTVEQERVCMKALAPRASDRYATAKEFAEELQWLLDHQLGATLERNKDSNLPVVPKGLCSFDATDSDFFLRLLPGPYNREGIPESLRFWKNRIETTDIEKTFRVGLVYGPSGCGKSSLMKAGLLPRLGDKILSVYIEATPDETETRLKQAVSKRILGVAGDSLSEMICNIRKDRLTGVNGKLVLVIDQFEQWLVGRDRYDAEELADALRQCDGETVQAILMVRDDFWLAVSRFLKCIDIPIVERENSALVDLFEIDHAEKVLGLFGQAYGRLNQDLGTWSQDNKEFIKKTVEGLARNRKIVSVRLALFAEMMKGRQWVPKSLEEVGGTDGIGVTFLEETFNSVNAQAKYRRHAEAVRGLLYALLPEPGVEIKGVKKGESHLATASGYADQPEAFGELLTILHRDLKLITAVAEEKPEPSGGDLGPSDSGSVAAQVSYQLTHDYLVRSLREWLTRKRKETKQGRAELLLEERVAIWKDKRENKQLPSVPETLSIYHYTRPHSWDPDQQAMMKKSLYVHASTWGGSFIAMFLILGAILLYTLNSKAGQLVESLVESGSGTPVFVNIRDLRVYPSWIVRSHLKKKQIEGKNIPNLPLKIACSFFGVPLDSTSTMPQELIDAINHTDPDDKQKFTLPRSDTLNIVLALDKVLVDKVLGKDSRSPLEDFFNKVDEKSEDQKDQKDRLAERQIKFRKMARIAIVDLILGREVLAKRMCSTRDKKDDKKDIGPRSIFIEELKNWQFERIANDKQVDAIKVSHGASSLKSLEDRLKNLKDSTDSKEASDLLSAICLGLGGIDPDAFPVDPKNGIPSIIKKVYEDHNDGSVHSSAEWLLKKWGEADKFPIKNPSPSSEKSQEGREWRILNMNSLGKDPSINMTLLKWSYQGKPWWVGASEVDRDCFNVFLKETEGNGKFQSKYITSCYFRFEELDRCRQAAADSSGEKDSEGKVPFGRANLYDAMQFCNWLSIRHDLQPRYLFGELLTQNPDDNQKIYTVSYDAASTGFQLMNEEMWKSVCRAKTDTSFPFGEFDPKDPIVEEYIYCNEKFNRTGVARCGERKPNSAGFFDFLGNAGEWLEPRDPETLGDEPQLLAGRSFRDRASNLSFSGGRLPSGKLSAELNSDKGNPKSNGLRIALPMLESR
jgi:serine/threonine protein kinase